MLSPERNTKQNKNKPKPEYFRSTIQNFLDDILNGFISVWFHIMLGWFNFPATHPSKSLYCIGLKCGKFK